MSDATSLFLGLMGAALVAGWVDAVVGGGGLVQLPALLLGLPKDTPTPHILGTNKLSSVAGTAIATATYARRIRLDAATIITLIVASYSGSTGGAMLARLIPKAALTPIVFAAVVVVGAYTWLRPSLGLEHRQRHTGAGHLLRVAAIGLGVGAYDGILGPGTGTFFVILLVAVLGYGFLEATAATKIANLTTNVAAIAVFGWHGELLIGLGLAMAAANLTGGLLGARMALKHGNGFVRRVFLVVVGVLALKLGWDTLALFW